MHQSSVTNYFKVKKRPREDSKSKKCSKLVAVTTSTTTPISLAIPSSSLKLQESQSAPLPFKNVSAPKDSPIPIKASSDVSSPEESPCPVSKFPDLNLAKSPASKILSPVPPEKFFSPIKQNENIFASPIKLSEIRSPSKLTASPVLKKAAVKRLFDTNDDQVSSGEGVKPKKIPAFQRLNYLAQREDGTTKSHLDTPAQAKDSPVSSITINEDSKTKTINPSLPLPYKHKVLLEVFRGVETVSTILFNRNEVITFNKLKPAVQELIRTTALKEKYLGQILTVFPESYKLTQEKMKDPMTRQFAYQLVLTPTFTKSLEDKTSTVSPLQITERKQIFQNNLLKICHDEHKKFLQTLKPPICIPEGKKVTRWHPKFKLDELQDIPTSPLPLVPDMGQSSAKDVISKAQAILQSANPKMKAALLELQKKSGASVPINEAETEKKDGETTSSTPTPSTAEKMASTKASIAKAQLLLLEKAKNNPKMTKALHDILIKQKKAIPVPDVKEKEKEEIISAPTTVAAKTEKKGHGINQKSLAALKGISSSLLEKIRAREQEKSIQSLTLTPEQTKRRAMLGRLPDIVQIVRNTIIAEKKAALPIRLIIDRVKHSLHGAITEAEADQHLKLLHELLPQWLFIIKCTQGVYIKIDKEIDINNLLEQLREIIRKTK